MEGLDSLLQNKLAMQYLAGFGKTISDYGANTDKGVNFDSVNAVTNQAITAQNASKQQMQFIQMLKEAFNPATTSELKAGPKGLTMSLDPNSEMFKSLQGTGTGGPWEGMAPPLGTPGTSANPTPVVPTPTPTGGTTPNPFVSGQPSFSASDLAGLTPEIMASNLSGALNVVGMQQKLGLEREQLAQKTSAELFDMKYKIASLAGDTAYKSKLMNQIDVAIEEKKRTIPLGDTGVLGNADEFIAYQKLLKENNPSEVKLFEYARDKQGYKGTFMDFKNSDMTGHQKDFKAAKADGYSGKFNDWLLENAKAGAINLGTELEKMKAKSALSGQLALDEPKTFTDIYKSADKYVADNLWNKSPQEQVTGKARKILSDVELHIVSGGGKFTTSWTDKGNTKVYTVTWPNGDKKDYNVKLQ